MNIKIKESVRDLVRFTPRYFRTRHKLADAFSFDKVEAAVRDALNHVPYYIEHDYSSFLPNDGERFELGRFPVLSKDDVLGREIDFVSNCYCKYFLREEKTGGSSGKTMKLYYSPTLSIDRTVFPNMIYEKYVGEKVQLALLRGITPSGGRLYERVGGHRVVLSSQQMSLNNIGQYLKVLNDEKITCLLAYPSALIVFAGYIKDSNAKVQLPHLKAIMASSEIFTVEDKKYVKEAFNDITVIDYYSMSEFAAAAYSVDFGPYQFNNNYGYVEFLPTEHKTPQGNSIAKIIATSIMNSTMPLIRYDTGDLAEVDGAGNVVSIVGRVNHFAVNKSNSLVPCIVIFSNEPIKNVKQYQYYQDSPGVLELRVIPKDGFTNDDKLSLKADMEKCFHDTMDCVIKVVDSLEIASVGKLKRMIQKLDISEYRK